MLSRQKGFTLIELLVVVSIISLLASIVLASVGTARTKAAIANGKNFRSQLDTTYGADAGGWWDFNEGVGANAGDTTKNNNPVNNISGTAYSWVPGVDGQAISLTSADSVYLGSSTAMDSSSFTIAFWIKPTVFNAGSIWNNLFMGRENYTLSGFRFAYDSNGYLSFWTSQSGGTLGISSSKALGTDRFYHVAVTYAAGNAKIYIDGVQAGQAAGTYIPPVGAGLSLNGGVGGIGMSNASFDDVRFFSGSLLSSQVKELYLAGLAKHYSFCNLINYFTFC